MKRKRGQSKTEVKTEEMPKEEKKSGGKWSDFHKVHAGHTTGVEAKFYASPSRRVFAIVKSISLKRPLPYSNCHFTLFLLNRGCKDCGHEGKSSCGL